MVMTTLMVRPDEDAGHAMGMNPNELPSLAVADLGDPQDEAVNRILTKPVLDGHALGFAAPQLQRSWLRRSASKRTSVPRSRVKPIMLLPP